MDIFDEFDESVDIINQLDGHLSGINKMTDYLDEVTLDLGVPLVADILDFEAFVNSNPELFPEDDPETPLNEGYLRNIYF